MTQTTLFDQEPDRCEWCNGVVPPDSFRSSYCSVNCWHWGHYGQSIYDCPDCNDPE